MSTDKEFMDILSLIANSPDKIEKLLNIARQLLLEQKAQVNRNA